MTRLIIPLILIIASIGLFITVTDPMYQSTQALSTQRDEYADKLSKARDLKAQLTQLLSKRNTFSQPDMDKLEQVLPNNIDNIHLIIDINNIAARRGLALKNVSLGSVSNGAGGESSAAVANSGSPIGSLELGFSITSSYADFQAFLQDLEHSLRLIEVEKIDLKAGDTGDLNDYTVNIKTYWLH